jgi:hypothetical protein
MASNSEMYERGSQDAAQDDLNSFYYQHYYFYRRGYNDARRQQRGGLSALIPVWLPPLLILAGLALLVGFAAFWLLGSFIQQPSLPTPTLVPTRVVVTASPTVQPSPTPVPTIIPTVAPVLRIGGRVRVVNVGDAPLRARAKPGMDTPNRTVTSFAQGSEVTITEGPKQANGLTWWRIRGTTGEGWSAERSAEGIVFLEALP